jgi:hypothetical protein
MDQRRRVRVAHKVPGNAETSDTKVRPQRLPRDRQDIAVLRVADDLRRVAEALLEPIEYLRCLNDMGIGRNAERRVH